LLFRGTLRATLVRKGNPMTTFPRTLWLTVGAVCALGVLSSGCATKKYVHKTVAPVEQRVSDVDKKATENATKIGQLDEREKSDKNNTDERIKELAYKTDQATESAVKANEAASRADGSASNARSLAEKGLARSDELQKMVEGLDNYRQIMSENVLFAVGKSELSAEAKSSVDAAVQRITVYKRYVIEVQGFTDSTGSREANLVLSQRRAQNVVRYLNGNHKIPLRMIHILGMGAESPKADNKTREGRKQNRRVEIRVFVPETEGGRSS